MNLKNHPLIGTLKHFVFDLDHTALGGHVPYARLPDPFSAFLDELNDNGCRWSVNTTWDVKGQWELVRQSAVSSRPLFYMGEFGRTLAMDDDGGPKIVEDHTRVLNDEIEVIRETEMDELFSKICGACAVSRAFHYGHLFTITVREGHENTLDDILKNNPTSKLELSRSNATVNVKPAFLNKGLALKTAESLCGIPSARTMTCGDGLPDIFMMTDELATFAVAPGNADAAVKARVLEKNGKIGHANYSDGVLEAFRDYEPANGFSRG